MKIKICGLSRTEDIEAVNRALPDYIGFVFAKSKRQVTPQRAAELAAQLTPSIQKVGVFVNERMEQILELAKSGVMDMIQLHGTETPDFVTALKKQTSLPVIKAIRMDAAERTVRGIKGAEVTMKGTGAMAAVIESYEAAGVDLFLFDNGPGGTGESFEWNCIPQTRKPYLLAGGIGRDNAAAAAGASQAIALDASSGVETDGRKDAEKIRQLVELVHSL